MDAGKLRDYLLDVELRATIFFAPALDEHQHLIADIRTQQQIATLPCLLDQLILELALLSLALFACELVLWNRGSCSHLFAPDLAVERFPRTIAEPESQCTQPLLTRRGTKLTLHLSIQHADVIGQFGDKGKLLDRHREELVLERCHIHTLKLAIEISRTLHFPPGRIGRVQDV